MTAFLTVLALFAVLAYHLRLRTARTARRRREDPNYQTVRDAVLTQRGLARLEVRR